MYSVVEGPRSGIPRRIKTAALSRCPSAGCRDSLDLGEWSRSPTPATLPSLMLCSGALCAPRQALFSPSSLTVRLVADHSA